MSAPLVCISMVSFLAATRSSTTKDSLWEAGKATNPVAMWVQNRFTVDYRNTFLDVRDGLQAEEVSRLKRSLSDGDLPLAHSLQETPCSSIVGPEPTTFKADTRETVQFCDEHSSGASTDGSTRASSDNRPEGWPSRQIELQRPNESSSIQLTRVGRDKKQKGIEKGQGKSEGVSQTVLAGNSTSEEITIQIRNLPQHFSQRHLIEALIEDDALGDVDFVYIPPVAKDFRTKVSRSSRETMVIAGYGFVNFTNKASAEKLKNKWHGTVRFPKHWGPRGIEGSRHKVFVSIARIQGLDACEQLCLRNKTCRIRNPRLRPVIGREEVLKYLELGWADSLHGESGRMRSQTAERFASLESSCRTWDSSSPEHEL